MKYLLLLALLVGCGALCFAQTHKPAIDELPRTFHVIVGEVTCSGDGPLEMCWEFVATNWIQVCGVKPHGTWILSDGTQVSNADAYELPSCSAKSPVVAEGAETTKQPLTYNCGKVEPDRTGHWDERCKWVEDASKVPVAAEGAEAVKQLSNVCTGSCMTGLGETQEWPKSDPVDVPAIQKCTTKIKPNEVCPGEFGEVGTRSGYRWTCNDPERVLLTTESGKHFCHRIQP